MRDTLTYVHVHIIWTTWDRAPIIKEDKVEALYACIKHECHKAKASATAIGGVADHVHLLVDLPPTISIADLVKHVKGASSYMMNGKFGPLGFFKWQGAYAAFSVSPRDVPIIANYIARQHEHHRDNTTIPELEWEETQKQPNLLGTVVAPPHISER